MQSTEERQDPTGAPIAPGAYQQSSSQLLSAQSSVGVTSAPSQLLGSRGSSRCPYAPLTREDAGRKEGIATQGI